MNPIDTAETAMQKFVFDFLDRFGVSLTIVAVILTLLIKVVPKFAEIVPELAKVVIDKYRAETETIRDMQKVIVSFPSALLGFKNEVLTEMRSQHSSFKDTIGMDTDKRIEAKVDSIARKVSRGSEPDSDPPPRTSKPS